MIDVFNLNSDLDNYLKNTIYQEIEKSKNSTINGKNYFEDAKNIHQKKFITKLISLSRG